jgi:hypothetical protein
MPAIIDIRSELPRTFRKLRRMAGVTRIVIHHDAASPAPGSAGRELQRLRSYNRLHAGKGWGGISYHFAIGATGRIYKCADIGLKTAHAPGSNTTGVALMLMGNFTGAPPPEAQLAAARWLVAELRGGLPQLVEVIPHRRSSGSRTACPGDGFPDSMVQALLG